MSEDLRYKVQHLGDIFVDVLSYTICSARRHAKGVVLAYDIHELKNKRRHCLKEIGMRIVTVKKEGLTDLEKDDKLVGLFYEAGKLDKVIESYEKQRNETLSGCGIKIGRADSTS